MSTKRKKILSQPDDPNENLNTYLPRSQKDRLFEMTHEHNFKSTGKFIVALMDYYEEK